MTIQKVSKAPLPGTRQAPSFTTAPNKPRNPVKEPASLYGPQNVKPLTQAQIEALLAEAPPSERVRLAFALRYGR